MMSDWLKDFTNLLVDVTGITTIFNSDFYQNQARPVLDKYGPVGFKEWNSLLDKLYASNEELEQSKKNDDDSNGGIDSSRDSLSDIERALQEALKQIDSLESQLADQSSKTYVQVLDMYKGDVAKMNQLQNSISEMQAALTKAQIQHDQALSRLNRFENELHRQSVGGQRKAMKQAAATARSDVKTTNQNVYALTEGIAKAEAGLANIGRVEAMTPNETNDVIAMQVASQTGVPIAKTTTDPGKIVEISLPTSTTDVTLDEE